MFGRIFVSGHSTAQPVQLFGGGSAGSKLWAGLAIQDDVGAPDIIFSLILDLRVLYCTK